MLKTHQTLRSDRMQLYWETGHNNTIWIPYKEQDYIENIIMG